MFKWTTEKYSDCKYDVMASNPDGKYPRRLGHIVGAKDVWLAEAGYTDLGYHKTKIACIARGLQKERRNPNRF